MDQSEKWRESWLGAYPTLQFWAHTHIKLTKINKKYLVTSIDIL